jgi:hypothetical protein
LDISQHLFAYCSAQFAAIGVLAAKAGQDEIRRLATEAIEHMGQCVLVGTDNSGPCRYPMSYGRACEAYPNCVCGPQS